MEKKKLDRLLCYKLSKELKQFKKRVLRRDKESILNMAYEIDTKINLYELILELKDQMSMNQLQFLIEVPGLLEFLYEEWLHVPDSHYDELENTVWSLVPNEETKIIFRSA